jgi:hypothetical protein
MLLSRFGFFDHFVWLGNLPKVRNLREAAEQLLPPEEHCQERLTKLNPTRPIGPGFGGYNSLL